MRAPASCLNPAQLCLCACPPPSFSPLLESKEQATSETYMLLCCTSKQVAPPFVCGGGGKPPHAMMTFVPVWRLKQSADSDPLSLFPCLHPPPPAHDKVGRLGVGCFGNGIGRLEEGVKCGQALCPTQSC